MSDLKKTALYEAHQQAEAKMAPFAGWDMPLQYSSMKTEALAVRQKVGIFDVSHMGEFLIEGSEALKAANFLIPNDLESLAEGKALYSTLCNEEGHILDDLIAYKFSSKKILFCVNAANLEQDWEWMTKKTQGFDCTWKDLSSELCLLALQGPKTEDYLSQLEPLWDKNLGKFSIQLLAQNYLIARTGYTGEDGVEIFCPKQKALELWNNALKMGVEPCGLGARDVLRIEAGYPLYGQELSINLSPLDAGLKWTIKLQGEDFIGKQSLLHHQPKYQSIKLVLEKGIPRSGQKVFLGDIMIGEITSGTFSVILSKGIGIARVDRNADLTSAPLGVDQRGKVILAHKVKTFMEN